MNALSQNASEEIAISALNFLSSDEDLLMRFAGLTGILLNDMRAAAESDDFLIGVLDFFMSHEPDLLAWTESAQINPENVMKARLTLSPQDISGFE